MKLLFLLLLVTYYATAQNCFAYICNPPGIQWSGWACGMEIPSNSSEYALKVGECSKDEYCNVDNSPAACQSATMVQDSAYAGEPCDSTHSCWSGNCVNKTCSATPRLQACSQIWQCGVGHTCFGGVCYPLSEIGGPCTQDTDCVPNAGCNIPPSAGSGVCVPYLSIPPQEPVENCWNWGLSVNFLCASGFCYTQQTNDTNLFYCSDFIQAQTPAPALCEYGSWCQSSPDSGSGETIQNNCGCGADGNSYCQLFPGDASAQPYISDMRKYLNSTAIRKCNTARRPGTNFRGFDSYVESWCAQAFYHLTKEMLYNYYYVENYPMSVNAEPCVLESLMPLLYNATKHEELWLDEK